MQLNISMDLLELCLLFRHLTHTLKELGFYEEDLNNVKKCMLKTNLPKKPKNFLKKFFSNKVFSKFDELKALKVLEKKSHPSVTTLRQKLISMFFNI